MREIIFRGKDVAGNWYYGLLAHIDDCWYISNAYGIPTAYPVLPETIGQYTGVKDINDKKIFEGDIIKWQYECREKYHVIFEDGHFIGVKEYGFISLYDTDFEVIGNIHDNPEGVQ